MSLGALVDLARYPLDQPGSAGYRAVVNAARVGLRADGCAVVAELVTAEAVGHLATEIRAHKPETHFSTEAINPYFHVERDPDFHERHPVNTFIERSSGFIAGDAWAPDGSMATLFRRRELSRFIADCLEIAELHCYDDPLAGLTANILDPGQQFTWHFDTNEFAVTLLVEAADDGGLFEYVPDIRSPDDEGFDRIQAVLEGGREGVVQLRLRPGDLQIFRGRHALHRVTRVPPTGRPRHAAIFAYTAEPGVIGRVERTMQLFGRVLPAHEAAEQARVRSDSLID